MITACTSTPAATVDQLRERYARQIAGRSPDGAQGWLNWIARHRETGAAVGTVQVRALGLSPTDTIRDGEVSST
jgi:hypothetical protein